MLALTYDEEDTLPHNMLRSLTRDSDILQYLKWGHYHYVSRGRVKVVRDGHVDVDVVMMPLGCMIDPGRYSFVCRIGWDFID